MKRAILAVTQGGLQTSRKIKAELGGDIYTLPKLISEGEDLLPIDRGLKDFMKEIFEDCREIVMVMSCGIAVRSIAPYVSSKLTDPAVVVLDEKGRHVISLLSGHLGGANALAEKIAEITGGDAVITTASDTVGVESVDMIAKRYGLIMEDMTQVKKLTAMLVNGQKVAVVKEDWEGELDPVLLPASWDLLAKMDPDGAIYIGRRELLERENINFPVARLIVPDLVLGIGCKKDTPDEKLVQAVKTLFRQHQLSLKAVKIIATVDVKKSEGAIIKLANELEIPMQIIGREEIRPIEGMFSCSEFVRKTIGVGCVCEPVAYLASNKGSCLIPKTSFNGITLSVYQISDAG